MAGRCIFCIRFQWGSFPINAKGHRGSRCSIEPVQCISCLLYTSIRGIANGFGEGEGGELGSQAGDNSGTQGFIFLQHTAKQGHTRCV